MELDHIFLFVKDEATAREMMEQAGLRVNYSRAHPGQGTRNLCACLDDMYFELLWLDGSPIADASEAIGLGKRGRGDGSPIGLAWRGEEDVDCVPYAAPFLPPDMSIPVARASLDKSHPFVFQSPGGIAPINAAESMVGQRQGPNYGRLEQVTIALPFASKLLTSIRDFERTRFINGKPSIVATLSEPSGSTKHRFTWPLDEKGFLGTKTRRSAQS